MSTLVEHREAKPEMSEEQRDQHQVEEAKAKGQFDHLQEGRLSRFNAECQGITRDRLSELAEPNGVETKNLEVLVPGMTIEEEARRLLHGHLTKLSESNVAEENQIQGLRLAREEREEEEGKAKAEAIFDHL